jgi:hypothetical protein
MHEAGEETKNKANGAVVFIVKITYNFNAGTRTVRNYLRTQNRTLGKMARFHNTAQEDCNKNIAEMLRNRQNMTKQSSSVPYCNKHVKHNM